MTSVVNYQLTIYLHSAANYFKYLLKVAAYPPASITTNRSALKDCNSPFAF